jgi:HEPN domain-containing protein
MPSQPPITFEALLRDILPTLDAGYAKAGRPVQDRPLAAARFIVEHMIVEIEGETKEEYFLKPWFAGIYQPSYDWLERRYGTGLTVSRQAHTYGLVDYLGSLLSFRLPLVFTSPGEDGTSWVHFPNAALCEEPVLSWINNLPPWNELPARRRAKLEASVRSTATQLRRINVNLNTADIEQPKARSLVGTVMRHFEKAAADAVSVDHSAMCLAVWELQMACEKTMKGFLAQRLGEYPETHNLRALHKLAAGATDLSDSRRHLSAFPAESRVIAWRYSEIPAPKPSEFLRFYVAATNLCQDYSEKMHRKIVFKNFALQIKAPPWRSGV